MISGLPCKWGINFPSLYGYPGFKPTNDRGQIFRLGAKLILGMGDGWWFDAGMGWFFISDRDDFLFWSGMIFRLGIRVIFRFLSFCRECNPEWRESIQSRCYHLVYWKPWNITSTREKHEMDWRKFWCDSWGSIVLNTKRYLAGIDQRHSWVYSFTKYTS